MRYINVSRLKEFAVCPTKFNFRYEQNVVPTTEDWTAADFGSAIHVGLKVWYEQRDVNAMIEAYRLFMEEHPEIEERLGYGETMLKAYVQTYPDQDWTIHGAEVDVEVPMPGDWTLMGRLDLIASTEMPPGSWHVQHKTVGNTVSLEGYVKQYELDWHERAYVLAARQNGWELDGIILNILRKTKTPSFHRQFLPITADQIEQFVSDFAAMTDWIDGGRRPQFPHSCTRFNRLCGYHGVCTGLVPFEYAGFASRERDYVDERNGGGESGREESSPVGGVETGVGTSESSDTEGDASHGAGGNHRPDSGD